MDVTTPASIALIAATVVLFFLLGVAIMILMDHKARLPGGFKSNPFSISGMRRDHPVEAFLTATILLGIIASLLLAVVATITGKFDLFKKPVPPKILRGLQQERSAERLRHFHNLPPQLTPTLGKKNVCFLCHGDFPHSKEPMVRAMLNMHTQFIGCMTCHVDARKVPEKTIALRWLNFSGRRVQGPYFGTAVDPETGLLVETDDYYSKIVAYTNYQGQTELLEITADTSEYQEFAKIQDRLTDEDREALKKKFHRLISTKGRFCSRCHTEEPNSYVPFRALDFSDQRIGDLTNLNIIGLVEKYKRFYVPKLFKTDKPLPPREVLTGPDRPAPATKPTPDLRKDPRSWWKGTYDAPLPAPKK